ncbi:hypothetical protein [Streptomyces sp. NPDC050485]|uniref:hypothetical protein n=1 Tax=Streptomyces sp. NPDC050485 TaxID=3365617 RepID=UPI0037B3EF0F
MEAGEFWAHRARAHDPVARVEVLRLGTKSPPRVKIRFTADEDEDREDWVPRSQLRVPWEQADQWLAEGRRWKALRAATPARDAPERHAVDIAFAACPWEELASVGYSRHDEGVLYVHDLAAFAEALEESTEFFTRDSLTVLRDDGSAEAPMPVALACARKGAVLYAERGMKDVEQQERQAQREAIYGSYSPGRGKREGHHFSPEICAEVDSECRPARDLVRQWCGAEAAEAFAELHILRAEVLRLGRIVEQGRRHAPGSRQRQGRREDRGAVRDSCRGVPQDDAA